MWLRIWWIFVAGLCCGLLVQGYEDITNLEDDDFAEFEQPDADELDNAGFATDEEITSTRDPTPTPDKFDPLDLEEDIIVEDEDNEFEHFQDPEEFEGFADSISPGTEQPKIIMTKVPIMPRPRWDAYWIEMILISMLAGYALTFIWGRMANTAIATNILKLHKPLLEENFTLVGDRDADVKVGESGWRREAEHVFTMWCSGRSCCEGMLLTLKFMKRQDLLHIWLNMLRPVQDSLNVCVEMSKDDCDPFVLCVASKKHASRLAKEMQDLSTFCGERRGGERYGLPSTLSVLSEAAEATALVLDSRVTLALTDLAPHLNYLHISDQYSGPKQLDDVPDVTKPPETQKVLILNFNMTEGGEGPEVRRMLLLVFYLLDKFRRTKLSKEALSKVDKNRQRAAMAFVRETHSARQEQAAARREERRKAEKERILAEDDPEKQRRWEKKEQKRQLKRKTPKMKQLKVKAL